MRITEGLKTDDLKDMIKPRVSIDQWASKIDDKRCVVIGFFVSDLSAANDLNRFIQKSYIEMYDTDISPAPTTDGDYMVFVELARDKHFGKRVEQLLRDIHALCDIAEWEASGFGEKSWKNLDIAAAQKAVLATPRAQLREALGTFFCSSDLSGFDFDGRYLKLGGGHRAVVLEYVNHGNIDKLRESYKLNGRPVAIISAIGSAPEILQEALGANWEVVQIDEYVLAAPHSADDLVLMREV